MYRRVRIPQEPTFGDIFKRQLTSRWKREFSRASHGWGREFSRQVAPRRRRSHRREEPSGLARILVDMAFGSWNGSRWF